MSETIKRVACNFALAAASFIASLDALAQESRGAYVGASVGQASYKHTCDGAPAGITCDNSDTAGRVFAGYQFKPGFAMELGFHDLGTAVARGSGPAGVTERADVSAFDFMYVGSWPIGNRFALLAKLGFYYGEIRPSPPPGAGARRNWESWNATEISFAAGASYVLTQRADFRLEWQHFGHFGTGSAPSLDINLLSLAALYRF